MVDDVWLAVGFVVLLAAGFLAWRAGRIWRDAGRRGLAGPTRLGWALRGALFPAGYWWTARLQAMTAAERDALLARETAQLGLHQANSQRCPLCGAKIRGAWSLTTAGEAAVARGPIECPDCDFRLDACRHCRHFMPGKPQDWGQVGWHHDDLTHGRCGHYKTVQPVEVACAPDMARQMKVRGYDRLRAPRPIADSFVPPDSCRAFQADRQRLAASESDWPDARRRALLRLLSPAAPQAATPAQSKRDTEEQWLL
jgi:hypothetical protein